ncbi:hypothetical protein S40288_09366 [Stachybotrys chartarum IBT 40288]|nr:hypothetical protein S40288_09366 [Stachybotrys chartarum IBT 40288]
MGSQGDNLDIVIVGGGITGLTVALGLIKRGLHVRIYERAGSFREIGAGVGFSANAEWAMKVVDPRIHDMFKKVATRNTSDWFQYVDGQHPGEEIKLLFQIYLGERGFEGCSRPDFLEGLERLLPDGIVQFQKSLESIVVDESQPSKKALLKFSDGFTTSADIVLGCDGIHSRVRQCVLGHNNPAAFAHYSHKFAIRGLIPMEKAVAALGEEKPSTRFMYLGPDAHVLTFPVAMGKYVNVVGFVSDPKEWTHSKLTAKTTRTEAAKSFVKFGPTVRTIIDLLPDELDQWAVFDTLDHPAPSYVRGQVVLLGDAAHASSPHHGAGAGCGIEDAAAMSELLSDAAKKLLNDPEADRAQVVRAALRTYDAVRHDRASWVVETSRYIGELYEWQTEAGSDTQKCHKEAYERCHKIWDYDVDEMVQKAHAEFAINVR